MATKGRSMHISVLPDQLLGRILGLAGREHGPLFCLVSKRWRAVALAEPLLWRSLTLTPGSLPTLGTLEEQQQWLAAKRRLLQQVAALVASATVHSAGQICSKPPPRGAATGCQLAALLRQLRPGVLRSLALMWRPAPLGGHFEEHRRLPPVPAAAVAALPRFRHGLTALCAESWQLPKAALTALVQLTGLQQLELVSHRLPDTLVGGIAASLQQLTGLKLVTARPLPPIQQLTTLQRLRRLQLCGHRERASEQPLPAPALFPCLAQYEFLCICCSFNEQGRSPVVEVADAAGPVARLSSASFAWPRTAPDCYSRFSALQERQSRGHLRVTLYQEAPAIAQPSQLGRLLSALVPRGHRLLGLTLHSNAELPLAAFNHDALSSLTALELGHSYPPDLGHSVLHLLPSLLGQALHLEQLTLDVPGGIPPCLTSYRGLTGLELRGVRDADWPTGPYLQSLQEIKAWGYLAHLPAALTGAVNLRRLLISNTAIVLELSSVEDVLLRLPRLQTLHMEGIKATPAAMVRLARGAPQLEILASDDLPLRG